MVAVTIESKLSEVVLGIGKLPEVDIVPIEKLVAIADKKNLPEAVLILMKLLLLLIEVNCLKLHGT